MNFVRKPVGVQAYYLMGISLFQLFADKNNVLRPFHRLAVAAENYLIKLIGRVFVKLCQNFLVCGFSFKPQAVAAVCAVAVVAYAERAVAGASVGQIYIKIAMNIINKGKTFQNNTSYVTF